MARSNRCPHGTCEWKPTRSFYEICAVCRDVFPCRFNCGHFDCIEARITAGKANKADHDARNARPKHPVKGIPVWTGPLAEQSDEEPSAPNIEPGEYA